MKQIYLLLAIFISGCAEGTDNAQQEFENEAQITIGQFAGNLKTALRIAITSGGVESAIAVCQEQAPEIAEAQSDEMQMQVSRTSLKVRNPDNSPAPWQEKVLNSFQQQKVDGKAVDELTFSEISDDGSEMRYMQAIGTQPLCLNCHGTDIESEVMAEIKQRYPADQATGYRSGDIRGAFSVVKSLSD